MIGKVTLTDGTNKTLTWSWLEDDMLTIEYYDFSELAYYIFGNNVVYTLTVSETERLLFLTKRDQESLTQWLSDNFQNFFGIKHWLEENKVAFCLQIEKLQ